MLIIFSFNSSYILTLLPLFLAHMDLVERGKDVDFPILGKSKAQRERDKDSEFKA